MICWPARKSVSPSGKTINVSSAEHVRIQMKHKFALESWRIPPPNKCFFQWLRFSVDAFPIATMSAQTENIASFVTDTVAIRSMLLTIKFLWLRVQLPLLLARLLLRSLCWWPLKFSINTKCIIIMFSNNIEGWWSFCKKNCTQRTHLWWKHIKFIGNLYNRYCNCNLENKFCGCDEIFRFRLFYSFFFVKNYVGL